MAFFAVRPFGAGVGNTRHAFDQFEGAQVGQDVFVARQVGQRAVFEGGFERGGMGAVPVFGQHDRLAYLRSEFVAHGFGNGLAVAARIQCRSAQIG